MRAAGLEALTVYPSRSARAHEIWRQANLEVPAVALHFGASQVQQDGPDVKQTVRSELFCLPF
jgi:hypothetical protein